MEGQSAGVHKAPDPKPGGGCCLLPVMLVVMMLMSVLMCMTIAMAVLMLVPVCVLMGIGVLLAFCFFCHGMPMCMLAMIMCMIVLMLVIVSAEFALLGVVLNAIVMAVCCLMLLHGCGSSDCTPVLALNVEVGDQCLCFPAKDLVEVQPGMLTSKNLQAKRTCAK